MKRTGMIRRKRGLSDASWAVNAFPGTVRAQAMHRAGWGCERCHQAPLDHLHHRRPRGMGGGDVDNTISNCAVLCRRCHEWVHAHPTEAYETGWLIRRGDDDPDEIPVMDTSGVRWWLTPDGERLTSAQLLGGSDVVCF